MHGGGRESFLPITATATLFHRTVPTLDQQKKTPDPFCVRRPGFVSLALQRAVVNFHASV